MKKTVLVVEDAESVLLSLQTVLQLEGFRVLTAENGQIALDLLESEIPDLIIADIMMPVVDGYTLYREVHKNPFLKPIPFLFLTAKGAKKDIRIGKEMGVDEYIVKPFDTNDLLAAINGKLNRMTELRDQKAKEIKDLSDQILDYLTNKLRFPLSTIRNYTQRAKDPEYSFAQKELKTTFSKLKRSIEEIDEFVEKVTLLNRLDKFMSVDDFMDGAVVVPLMDMVRYIEKKWSNNINLETQANKETLYVRGRTEYLIRVFDELLDNARKNLKNIDDKIYLRVQPDGTIINLEVVDHGHGIKVTDIKQVFNKFYQCESPAKTIQGSGLGLSLAKIIVELHRGTIAVKSSIDVGCIFCVSLPRFVKS